MLKKLKQLLGDDNSPAPLPPPSPPSGTAPKGAGLQSAKSKAAPKPVAKGAPPKPMVKTPTPSSTATVAAVPICEEYRTKSKDKHAVVLELYQSAVFEGVLACDGQRPVAGTMLYPNGTRLNGTWSEETGLFMMGSAVFAATQHQEQSGDWVPLGPEDDGSMNDKIGVRLLHGVIKDKNYRSVSVGHFVLYKKQWIRLSCGRRCFPLATAPKDVVYASELPSHHVSWSVGEFNTERNVVRHGATISPTVVSAGTYWIDGGTNYLKQGVMWTSVGVYEGRYRRRAEYLNGASVTSRSRDFVVGLWRAGAGGSHLQFGIRVTDKGESCDFAVDSVEVGMFSLAGPRRLVWGRRSNLSSDVQSEGVFCPFTNTLIAGSVVSKALTSESSVVVALPSENAAIPDKSEIFAAASAFCGIAGFRKWSVIPAQGTAGTADVQKILASIGAASTVEEAEALRLQLPTLTEAEVLQLEDAWYEGASDVELSSGRGTVVFGEHIDEGLWTLLLPDGNGSASLLWEERPLEAFRLRSALPKKGLSAAAELFVQQQFSNCGSSASATDDEPSPGAVYPLRRWEWRVHDVDLATCLTTFSYGSGELNGERDIGVNADASTLVFSHEDQSALDQASHSRDSSYTCQTSLGYVNMAAPLRHLSAVPLTVAEEAAYAKALPLTTRECSRRSTFLHQLFAAAVARSKEDPAPEMFDGVDVSKGTAAGDLDATAPRRSRSSLGRVQHVSRHYLSLREHFQSTEFKRRFVAVNCSQDATNSHTRTPHVGAALHVPLSPDADIPHAYRHSWGFVLEYLHRVALRHGCIPLILPLTSREIPRHQCGGSSPLERLCRLPAAPRDDLNGFASTILEILDEWSGALRASAGRLVPQASPCTSRLNVSQSPCWPHGILCRFLGDAMGVTAAACDASLWMSRRTAERVERPPSWNHLLSKTPTRVLNDDQAPHASLYVVEPTSLEYGDVHNCLYGMQFPSTWTVVKLERVHNEHLYERYIQKRRAIGKECRHANTAGESGCNERRWLAHGTRGNDPMIIARNGFDHRYSEVGLFGRAAYFAYDPVYSHSYRHETGTAGQAQMFLASVTAGQIELRDSVDKEIKHPKQGYHSVEGPLTDRFRGLMVYDLDQAYPSYLVTYKYA